MANERIVRTPFLRGTLSSPLMTGGTTLNAAILAILPTLGAKSFAKIIIDSAGTPEVVYVTAHTSPATSATIVRAREGTADPGSTYAIGTPITLQLTDYDFRADPAGWWGGDSADDIEFDRLEDPTTLPSGAAWLNQGAADYLETWGKGRIYLPGETAAIWRGVDFALAAAYLAGTKTILSTRFRVFSGAAEDDAWWAGVYLRSASDEFLQFSRGYSSGAGSPSMFVGYWSDDGTLASPLLGLAIDGGILEWWLTIVRNAANDWDFYLGPTLDLQMPIAAAFDLSAILTPTRIGLGIYCSNDSPVVASIDFIRYR